MHPHARPAAWCPQGAFGVLKPLVHIFLSKEIKPMCWVNQKKNCSYNQQRHQPIKQFLFVPGCPCLAQLFDGYSFSASRLPSFCHLSWRARPGVETPSRRVWYLLCICLYRMYNDIYILYVYIYIESQRYPCLGAGKSLTHRKRQS
jgi:hypothetical protein